MKGVVFEPDSSLARPMAHRERREGLLDLELAVSPLQTGEVGLGESRVPVLIVERQAHPQLRQLLGGANGMHVRVGWKFVVRYGCPETAFLTVQLDDPNARLVIRLRFREDRTILEAIARTKIIGISSRALANLRDPKTICALTCRIDELKTLLSVTARR